MKTALSPRSDYPLQQLSNGDHFAMVGDKKRKVYYLSSKGSFESEIKRWNGFRWEASKLRNEVNVKYLHSGKQHA